jgi:hypothetical protein
MNKAQVLEDTFRSVFSKSDEGFQLSDESISQIALCLSLSMLTGHDVEEFMRAIRFVESDGKLQLSEKYLKLQAEFVENLLEKANKGEIYPGEKEVDA